MILAGSSVWGCLLSPVGDFPVQQSLGGGLSPLSECIRTQGGGGQKSTFKHDRCFDLFPPLTLKLLNTVNEKCGNFCV